MSIFFPRGSIYLGRTGYTRDSMAGGSEAQFAGPLLSVLGVNGSILPPEHLNNRYRVDRMQITWIFHEV